MEYKVIYKFKDLEDDNYIYSVGDTYPRTGTKPSKERIEALSTTNNKIGKIIIEAKVDKKKDKKPEK